MNIKNIINGIFYPRKSNKKDNNDYFVQVDDDVNVNIRFYLNSNKSDNIIFFHGNAEIADDYENFAKYYNELDINLIVCEYRGYGLSTGTPTKDNLQKDSLEIFKFIENHLSKKKHTGKIVIMGRSLGSCSAANIIFNYQDKIDGCIIESGFATEYSLLQLMQINPNDINFKLSDGFENLKKFKAYKKPLLIIHADLDDIVPMSQADLIMMECPSNDKDLYVVNGANHNNILMYANENYFIKIKSFISSL